MPPPVLPEMVLLRMIRVPSKLGNGSMPTPPPLDPEVLPVMTTSVSVTFSSYIKSPPPSPITPLTVAGVLPPVIVIPEMATSMTPGPFTSKTRNRVAAAGSRRTVSWLTPVPAIVSGPVIGNSPVVSEIVRATLKNAGSKPIKSGPVLKLASRIAWRSDPAPPSLALLTVNVAGAIRPSRASSSSRARLCRGCSATTWPSCSTWSTSMQPCTSTLRPHSTNGTL